PPRAAAGHQGRQHHAGREVHARGRRVHRRLHRGPLPAGELPLLPPGDPRAGRRAARRPAGRQAGARRAPPRHARPGAPAAARHAGRRRPARPQRRAAVAQPQRAPERGGIVTDVDATAGGAAREVPRIVSARWDLPDGFTLDRYRATGGYEALRKAVTSMTPAEVTEEVKAASLLGRGGAGFPAGVKWGFCPPGVFPRYVVVNGDE